MLHQRAADLVAETGDNVEHARWEPRFLEELGELQRESGGELRWLDDNSAAGGEGRCDLPTCQQQRRVPRVIAATTPTGSLRVKVK